MVGVKREYFSDDDGDRSPDDSTSGASASEHTTKKSKTTSAAVNGESTKTKPRSKTKATKPDTDSGKSRGSGKKWTGPELEALHAALGGSVPVSRFNDKVPGRTQSQCEQTWR